MEKIDKNAWTIQTSRKTTFRRYHIVKVRKRAALTGWQLFEATSVRTYRIKRLESARPRPTSKPQLYLGQYSQHTAQTNDNHSIHIRIILHSSFHWFIEVIVWFSLVSEKYSTDKICFLIYFCRLVPSVGLNFFSETPYIFVISSVTAGEQR